MQIYSKDSINSIINKFLEAVPNVREKSPEKKDSQLRLQRIAVVAGMIATMATLAGNRPAVAGGPEQLSVYPSTQTISATGELPASSGSEIVMNTAIGGHDGAWLVVRNAKNVSAVINETANNGPSLKIDYGHFVKFGAKLVPDALMPWDGAEMAVEQPNQPLYVGVETPYNTAPGNYKQTITLNVDGTETEIPVATRVFSVSLPQPNKATAVNPITSFNVSPQTYLNTSTKLYNYQNNQERQDSYNSLYAFLAKYRISPASWGFGDPRTPAGYTQSPKWWQNSRVNMINAVGEEESAFAALRISLSTNRTDPDNYIAGLNPSNPESWCDYLKSVYSFWNEQGWLKGTLPYLYGQDEPGLAGQKLVERQAKAAHKCFPGSKIMMTGNPSPTGENDFLLDDLDIWTILISRFYGVQNSASGFNRAEQYVSAINKIRNLGKIAWSYHYNVPGTPGYTASEPLSDPRMFMLWNALERNSGTFYAQGITTYDTPNPLKSVSDDGEHVLIYPGQDGPIASARLEQIRNGIEDWALINIVSKKIGMAAVRKIIDDSELFSIDKDGFNLACRAGCELENASLFAWPEWSSDTTTPAKIESARLKILNHAGR